MFHGNQGEVFGLLLMTFEIDENEGLALSH